MRIRMDTLWFGSLNPDPHLDKKLDTDPYPHCTNADPQHWFVFCLRRLLVPGRVLRKDQASNF